MVVTSLESTSNLPVDRKSRRAAVSRLPENYTFAGWRSTSSWN